MVNKYRLTFGPSIKKGSWYLGVVCKGCGQPILCLENPEAKPVSFSGEGLLSIPCEACDHDDTYLPAQVQQFQATEDRLSFRDHRPTPSGQKPYPFLPVHKKLRYTFGPGAIEQRPDISKVITRIIAYWTSVETQKARLLSIVMNATTESAIAVYLSLRNSRQKTEALEAAARLTLEAHDYELFQALMRWNDKLEKSRNDVAHGVLGVCAPLKEAIVWMSTSDMAAFQAKAAPQGLSDELEDIYRKKVWVYPIGYLESVAREIEEFYNQVGFFLGYLLNHEVEWRSMRYPQLCNVPQIQKELRQIRQGLKNNAKGKK